MDSRVAEPSSGRPAHPFSTLDYHYRQCPTFIPFSLALSGYQCSSITRQCDLASHNGLSLVLHAACNPEVSFCGTHSDLASELAAATDADRCLPNLTLLRAPFWDTDAAPRGPFDVVTLDEAWGQLSDTERTRVAGVARELLSNEGLFCLTYGTRPGKDETSTLTAVFEALTEASSTSTADVSSVLRKAVAFFDTNPGIVNVHWNLRETTEDLLDKDAAAVAHAFFDTANRPVYFRDVDATLRASGFHWTCPWDAVSRHRGLHLTPRQDAFLASIPDPVRREQARDFVVNKSQRNDVFRKGHARRTADSLDLLSDYAFILTKPVQDFEGVAHTALGAIALSAELYGPILDSLASLQPTAMLALETRLAPRFTRADVADAIGLLVEQSMVQIVKKSEASIARARPTAHAFNEKIIDGAVASKTIRYLGSPVTGAGIEVSQIDCLFIQACRAGETTPVRLVAHAATAMHKPQPVDAPADSAALEALAARFVAQKLPILSALQAFTPPGRAACA